MQTWIHQSPSYEITGNELESLFLQWTMIQLRGSFDIHPTVVLDVRVAETWLSLRLGGWRLLHRHQVSITMDCWRPAGRQTAGFRVFALN